MTMSRCHLLYPIACSSLPAGKYSPKNFANRRLWFGSACWTQIFKPQVEKKPQAGPQKNRGMGSKTFHACSMSLHITDRLFCKHLSISKVSSQFFTKPSRANYLFPTTICPWLLVIYDYRHKTHRYSLAFASRSSSTTTLNL